MKSWRVFTLDARRGDGKRYIIRADEMLTPFIQLEAAFPKARP